MLLLATAVVNASPTVTSYDAILSTRECSEDTPTIISRASDNVVVPINAELATLGREILQPPASFAGLSNTKGNLVKPLPAVPGALLMVLTGFLCVSLVKDRRVWLAALAGLLWVGQAGIHALPQLALRLNYRIHSKQQHDAERTYPYYLENSNRLRSDIEGTQYIGLLHHLAGIPNASLVRDSRFSILDSRFLRASSIQHRASSINTSQLAFLSEQYSLDSLFKCLASKTEQFICFSPAFIFELIPRGPPKLT